MAAVTELAVLHIYAGSIVSLIDQSMFAGSSVTAPSVLAHVPTYIGLIDGGGNLNNCALISYIAGAAYALGIQATSQKQGTMPARVRNSGGSGDWGHVLHADVLAHARALRSAIAGAVRDVESWDETGIFDTLPVVLANVGTTYDRLSSSYAVDHTATLLQSACLPDGSWDDQKLRVFAEAAADSIEENGDLGVWELRILSHLLSRCPANLGFLVAPPEVVMFSVAHIGWSNMSDIASCAASIQSKQSVCSSSRVYIASDGTHFKLVRFGQHADICASFLSSCRAKLPRPGSHVVLGCDFVLFCVRHYFVGHHMIECSNVCGLVHCQFECNNSREIHMSFLQAVHAER